MDAPQLTTKRVAISKANAQMIAVIGIASFVAVFCLVAANAVWGQIRYQARVTTAKNQANDQLKKNIENYNQLAKQYDAFNGNATNIIGGSAAGSGDKDGNNAKIILDALPSSYDFPGLTSSLEKILNDKGFKSATLSGTDDELNQQNNLSSPTPQPVSMPFTLSVSNSDYASVQQLVTTLQQSIRPIQVDSVDISGGVSNMSISIKAHTYYQPAKSLNITKRVVQ